MSPSNGGSEWASKGQVLAHFWGVGYGRGRCPVCGEKALSNEWICPSCATPHHEECVTYFGGCGVFGCKDGTDKEQLQEQYWPEPVRLLERVWVIRRYQTQALLGCAVCPAVAFLGLCLAVPVVSEYALPIGLGGLVGFGLVYLLLDVVAHETATALKEQAAPNSIDALEISPKRLGSAFSRLDLDSELIHGLVPAGVSFGLASLIVAQYFGVKPFVIVSYIAMLLLATRAQLYRNRCETERLLDRLLVPYDPRRIGADKQRKKRAKPFNRKSR